MKAAFKNIVAILALVLVLLLATTQTGAAQTAAKTAAQTSAATTTQTAEQISQSVSGQISTQMAEQTPPARKKVGLVLSGGGAKGVAHISVIKALEQAGIPIDYIAGTSMGAIIGGLYSIGYSTHVLDSMVRTQDWDILIYDRMSRSDLSFGAKEFDEKYLLTIDITPDRRVRLPSGLIGGHNVYNLIYELTYGYHDYISFKDLPIPFACIGFDMVSGRAITLDRGHLPVSIRASMSMPGAFYPVVMDTMVLVDGGVGNNFPADIVKAMGADVIIGVDVMAPLRTQYQLNSFTDIFEQLTGFMSVEKYQKNLELADLYIHPDITGYSAMSFSHEAIDSLLARGEMAAAEHWDQILALKEKLNVPYDFVPEPRKNFDTNPSIPIGEIRFWGLKSENERALRRIIRLNENTVVSRNDLRQAVNKLLGTKTLSDVHYRLDGDSVYTVTFEVKEFQRSTISAGLRFDTEEMAAILLAVKYSDNSMPNSYINLIGRLGTNPYGRFAYVYGNETQRRTTGSYTFRSNDLSLYQRGEKVTNLDFYQHSIDLNHSNIQVRNFRMALGLRYDYYYFRSMITNRQADDIHSLGLISYYALAQWESLDSRHYPRHGTSALVSYTLHTSNFINYKDGPPFSAIEADYLTAIPLNKRLTLIPGLFSRVLIGRNVAYPSENFMGGAVRGRYVPQQMAFVGLTKFEKFDRSVVGVRLDARVRLFEKNYISLKTNYAKHSNNFFDILNGESLLGFGVNYSYNSVIGPIDLLIDYSNFDKKVGVYFNLGYYF